MLARHTFGSQWSANTGVNADAAHFVAIFGTSHALLQSWHSAAVGVAAPAAAAAVHHVLLHACHSCRHMWTHRQGVGSLALALGHPVPARQGSTKHTQRLSPQSQVAGCTWLAPAPSAHCNDKTDTGAEGTAGLHWRWNRDSLLWLLLTLQHALRLACAAVHWSAHSVSALVLTVCRAVTPAGRLPLLLQQTCTQRAVANSVACAADQGTLSLAIPAASHLLWLSVVALTATASRLGNCGRRLDTNDELRADRPRPLQRAERRDAIAALMLWVV